MGNPKINTPADGQCGYLALYDGKRAEVWADSSYQAKQRAEAYFKPTKRKAHLLSVHLCENNGVQVVHTADF